MRASEKSAKQKKRQLVPTRYSSPFRDTGKYDSCERLPDLDLLIARTLRQVEESHRSRERSSRSFETLWRKVCTQLAERGNAASFEYWKTTNEMVKNIAEIKALDAQIASAWMSVKIIHGEGENSYTEYRHSENFEALQKKREEIKPRIKTAIDDLLEVAIAYWIEAKNARDQGDDTRALHSLIPCHLYIGMTLSPKTESESKSDAGSKRGKTQRDALVSVVVETMRSLEIDQKQADEDFLCGQIAELIEKSPEHSEALVEFDISATKGKKLQVRNRRADRFAETLRKWMNSKDPAFADLQIQRRRIAYEVGKLQPSTSSRKTRQPHS